MPADDTTTDSSNEEGPSVVIVPTRPAPPRIAKVPPPPEDNPPPYSSSYHAQASGLLSSSAISPRPVSQVTNNRNSRTPPAHRKYTQYLTKRNLLILAGILLLLVFIVAFLAWIGGSDDSDQSSDSYYAPTLGPTTHPSDRAAKPLEVQWKLLGAFTEFECVHPNDQQRKLSCLFRQRMSFDEDKDAILLSKYLPTEHTLKSEMLKVDQPHTQYISSSHNISQIYQDCARFTDQVICCSTSPHGHQHRTDCYLNIDNQVLKSTATHYDFVHNWQSLLDDNQLLIVVNKQRHAVLNLKTKKIHKIEENRLPHGYISEAFFFPMDNAGELDELVRVHEDFKICEYKQTRDDDYALQSPECQTTPFHVEFELPKVRFCSNPLYKAIVQYGHLQDETDITFSIKVVFDSNSEVYTARESLESNYDQLVIDCNDEAIEVYVMGSYEIAKYTVKMPNLRTARFIQTHNDE